MISITQKKLVIGGATLVALVVAIRQIRRLRSTSARSEASREVQSSKGRINRVFLEELRDLLKIVMPTLYCKEALLLTLHTAALVFRTFLSIQVANLDGKIVKTIVDRNKTQFIKRLLQWLLLAIPATYTNSMIRFLESKLAIAFRTKLTMHLYKLYMDRDTYYRVENLDSRLANADQRLTEDVSRFCGTLAHLHSQVSKPTLDVVLMSIQLVALNVSIQEDRQNRITTSVVPCILAGITVWLTARALKFISPPFGRLVAQQAELEGEFRYAHSRLITNSEEIAFYNGHKVEKAHLKHAYLRLIKHMNKIFKLRIFYNMAEGFLMKYFWSAAGLMMIAIPAFTNTKASVSARTQDFITARGLLISAADAIERIMSSYKELTELTGYTSRVAEMIKVFREVHDGKYQKTMVNQDQLENASQNDTPVIYQRGQVTEDSFIQFDKVPIVSPNGDVLVHELSFTAQPGMHILISGPNGCGKSSLFRILGGLWPACGGRLVKPERGRLFYIPQRPYLCVGSLREQIIYPDSLEDFHARGMTDEDLNEIMQWVYLRKIVRREGGWDAVNDWQDVLSGGEKQRVGMARIFYHRPSFAILDECTSAVSIDVEGFMYNKAKELGITLLTVTHRPSLWKYHDHLLQFDGQGGWKFEQLSQSTRGTLKEEKTQLESQLSGVPAMQKRLQELCVLLGEESVLTNPDEELVVSNSDDEEDDADAF